jgi:hypothetical protein
MRTITLLSAITLACGVHAQPAVDLLTRMRRTYQEESKIYLKHHTVVRIERAGNGAVATRTVEEEELYLKDQGGAAREREVHYSSLVELKDIEAYTLALQGKGYKRMNVDRFDHKDRRDEEIFHDDTRVASFVMPNITAGSIGHVRYTLQYQDARMAMGHYFGVHIPTEESSLTVISDPGIDVEVRTFNLADSTYTRSDRTERGKRVQQLSMTRVPGLPFEDHAPSWKYHSPHAQIVVRLPGAASEVALTDGLYRWYREMADSATSHIHPDVQRLADSIAVGEGDDARRAALLYRWVQDHVRYVAFEDGMNGYVPAAPEEVLRVRYGDCKGMSGLLTTLLQAAGLKAHITWIGTRDLPYTYSDLPSAASTNHMIVALDLADSTLFLDPTSRSCGFGVPSGFIQGKEAMINNGPDKARIVPVPAMPASFSTTTDSVFARIEGTTLLGTGIARYTGYDRYHVAELVKNVPVERHPEMMRALLMKGSNAFLVDSFQVSGVDDRDAPLVVRYQFRIPGIVMTHGERLFLPPHLEDPWAFMRSSKPRKLPIELNYRSTHRSVLVLQLPAGMRCTTIPAPFQLENEALSISMNAAEANGQLVANASFITKSLLLSGPAAELPRLNTELPKAMARTLVIERP